MFHLELDAEERDILAETLNNYLSDLRYEISDTDRMEFREKLKKKKNVLNKIVKALQQASEGTGG